MTNDPLIGRQLANFRIERAIGRGGMAVVYYAIDIALHRPVAVKIIDVRYRDDPAYAERFVREARAIVNWRHENIVQIYYAGQEDGLSYFVMEYIDGPDLGRELARYAADDQLMPRAEVLRIGRAVASALDYAHGKGVIHRDVKPSNVLLSHGGRVVLSDFGLALDAGQGSLGEVIGSAHYIAPEQARRSAEAIPQSDLYALGVMLYEMLTGGVPFDDLSPAAIALQHITLPPPPPRERNPKLSVETERVLLRALHKTPARRYASGAKLMDALEKTLPAGRERSTRRPPAAPTLPSRTRAAATAPGAASGADLIGSQLDQYRVDAMLGEGGMARIYRAFDTQHRRHVAIKIIDARFRDEPDYVKRFQREAQAIGQIDHPNVVRLYRHGEANGLLYLAMQYVEGETLQATLAAHRKSRKRIPAKEALRIVREIGLALDHIHARGVIHRDVKPSNLIIDKQGRPVLTDFGLALLEEFETRGEIFGSPHYIAPEQAMSSAGATPQSDLYSLGVIVYEMFTGQLPFDAPDPLDIALLHMSEPPRPPRQIRSDISPELEAVILKALAKEPGDRYPTGAALADALDRALEDRPTKAPAAIAPAIKNAPRPLPPVPAAVAKPAQKSAARKTAKRATPAALQPPPQRRWRMPLFISLGVIVVIASAGLALLLNERDRNLAAGATPLEATAAGASTQSTPASPLITPTRITTPSATPPPSTGAVQATSLRAATSVPPTAASTSAPASTNAPPAPKANRLFLPLVFKTSP